MRQKFSRGFGELGAKFSKALLHVEGHVIPGMQKLRQYAENFVSNITAQINRLRGLEKDVQKAVTDAKNGGNPHTKKSGKLPPKESGTLPSHDGQTSPGEKGTDAREYQSRTAANAEGILAAHASHRDLHGLGRYHQRAEFPGKQRAKTAPNAQFETARNGHLHTRPDYGNNDRHGPPPNWRLENSSQISREGLKEKNYRAPLEQDLGDGMSYPDSVHGPRSCPRNPPWHDNDHDDGE
jgi:hypothetical protein